MPRPSETMRPAPTGWLSMFTRILPVWVAFSFAPIASAQTLTALDGTQSDLESHIQSSTTLILIVETPEDLSETLRLLTLADSENRKALALVALPSDKRFLSSSMERAARRFFKSDFSREHVYFIDASASPFAPSKALILENNPAKPVWSSTKFPASLPQL